MMSSSNKIACVAVACVLGFILSPVGFALLLASSSKADEAAGCSTGPTLIGNVPPSAAGQEEIPENLMPIYRAAEEEYAVPWIILAAINRVETEFGRNLNVSSAGAQGWMQFMPATWEAYGVDANGDGRKDPYDPEDAIFAAARYLKASGAPGDIRRAIFAYNHANWYVDKVLSYAQRYGQGDFQLGDSVSAGRSLPAGTCPVVAGDGRITTEGGAKGIVDQAVALAMEAGGEGVYVCSDFRPGSVTSSGNPSDHGSNDENMAARDIAVQGLDCILGPSSPKLDRAVVAIGEAIGADFGEGNQRIVEDVYWKGYRIQIIWRTPDYGGHDGHIHIGVRKQ